MLFHRNQLPELIEHLQDTRYSIITGARQVGKTSLLKMIVNHLQNEKKLVFQLTCEDPRLCAALNDSAENIFNYLPQRPRLNQAPLDHTRIYLCIDEIQYLNDPTHFLKYLFDTYGQHLKIIATGSSAFYLDRKFTDSLAGRKRIFQLYTLSFDEMLQFTDDSLAKELQFIQSNNQYQSLRHPELISAFYNYLLYGGYPAVVIEKSIEQKKQLLQELKFSYLKRDVLESGISHEDKFYFLLQLLADQTGNLLNTNELSKTLQLDSKTINQYIYILRKCFHIQLIKPYFRNLRKEITKMPKVYFHDLGLRNVLLNRFDFIQDRSDKGALLENFFFIQLRNRFAMDQIYFWRINPSKEIDFIVEKSFEKGIAYEVKWNKAYFSPEKLENFTNSYSGFSIACLSQEDFLKHEY